MERINTRDSVSSEAELIRNRPPDYGTGNETVLRSDASEPNKSPSKGSGSLPDLRARSSGNAAGPKESVTCNVCFEVKDFMNIYTFQQCLHSYCLDCLRDYLRTKILSNDCVDIRCMYPKCSTIIQYNEIRALIDPELFAKYETFSLQSALKGDPNTRWCPKAGCGIALIGDPANPEMRCACGHSYCFKCNEDWHQGTCEQYQEWKKENGMEDKKYNAWRKENTRPCPGCKNPIEKAEGCNHMTCVNCKFQFCWLCGGEYSENHYKLYNILGCPGQQHQNANLAKRTAMRFGVALGMFFGTVLVVGYSIAMPGNVMSVHGPPKLLSLFG